MTPLARPAAKLISWPRRPALPFVAAALLAWVAASGAPVNPSRYLAAGLLMLVAGIGAVAELDGGSARRLGILPCALPLVLAAVVLRSAVGGPWPGATELEMIPVLLAALHSRSRGHLALVLGAVAADSLGAAHGPAAAPHGLLHMSGPVLLIAVISIVAFAVQQLVGDARQSASDAAEQANTDPLTGLPNRRAWDRQLNEAVTSGRHVTVAILDLDEFKQFNDAHGHPAGDRLLVQAAARWTSALRAGDLIARLGGEEFGVMLLDTQGAEALEVTERLRTCIPFQRTCSAGVAIARRREQPSELVARADRALYEAKGRGRDNLLVAAERR